MRRKKFIFSKKLIFGLLLLVVAAWWLARPETLEKQELPNLAGNHLNGEKVFLLGGCGSCHGLVEGTETDPLRLGGGLEMDTPAGLFRVPNISSDPVWGIGGWTLLEFVNAMKYGVSPDGTHYYPAFPYTSYTRMTLQDIVDLKAYIDTLPAVDRQVDGHDLKLIYRLRWSLGIWKRLFLDDDPVVELDRLDPVLLRGRYLAEGAGHCGECHTPRNLAGAMEESKWLGGAPNPAGEGKVPNITSGEKGVGSWETADIAYFFETGVDPEFDLVGGDMVKVQENMALLDAADREAIAAYLKLVPAWSPKD